MEVMPTTAATYSLKNAEPLGEGGTQRLDEKSISNVNSFVNGDGLETVIYGEKY
jgi:hypothetical protein